MSKPLNNTAEPAEPNTGPPVNIHLQRANEVIASIDALVAELPAVKKALPSVARAHRAVSVPFMENVITIAQQYEEVRAITRMDATASADRLQQFSAYRTALRRAVKFVQEVTTVIDAIRTELAYDTLDTYAGIRRLAVRPGVDQPVFRKLEKELKRKRKTKEPADPAQTPGIGTTPSPGVTPPIAQTPASQKTEVNHK